MWNINLNFHIIGIFWVENAFSKKNVCDAESWKTGRNRDSMKWNVIRRWEVVENGKGTTYCVFYCMATKKQTLQE